jgi:hypothetical protein
VKISPRVCLACLLFLIAIIGPVSSTGIVVTGGNINLNSSEKSGWVSDWVYVAPTGDSISIMEFDVPVGTTVNFTLHYGASKVVEGSIYYTDTGLLQGYSAVTLGGDTYAHDFVDTGISVGCSGGTLGVCTDSLVKFSSYAKNTTPTVPVTGFALYAQGYSAGLLESGTFGWSQELVFFPVDDLASNLISQVEFSSTSPIHLTVDHESSASLASHVTQTTSEAVSQGAENALSSLMEKLAAVLTGVGYIWYWFQFLFIDHLKLTVVLYVSGTLCAACGEEATKSNPNIFHVLSNWFTLQVVIYKFFVWVIQMVVWIFNLIIQAVLKWV